MKSNASSDTISPMPMQQSFQHQRSLRFIRFSWGRLFIVLVVVVAAGILLAGRQLTRPRSGNIRQQLDSALRATVGQGKPIRNAALCVTKGDGSFTWCDAAGVANQDGKVPMTAATPFYIASITKLFTATAIMMLHEKGLIALNDPMAKYLPEQMIHGIQIYQGHDYSHEITVEQLLAHTSGHPRLLRRERQRWKNALRNLQGRPAAEVDRGQGDCPGTGRTNATGFRWGGTTTTTHKQNTNST